MSETVHRHRQPLARRLPRVCSSRAWVVLVALWLPGCAVLHHAQVGEVDSEVVLRGERFEVLVSALGVDVDRAAEVAKAFASTEAAKEEIDGVRDAIKSFQMGPKTGNVVFDDTFADGLFEKLRARCPGGRISGLVTTRETADYGMFSGEVVKISGYCQR